MPSGKKLVRPALMTAAVLLVLLAAMLLTDSMAWGPGDFALAGVLLFGAGLVVELVAGRGGNLAYRAGLGLAVAAALLMVWVSLAVGIIGSEGNPADLLYVGVLAVGLVGSVLARLRARAMARAMFATMSVQALVPLVALVIWKTALTDGLSLRGIVVALAMNTIFVILFAGSALLFRRAASTHREMRR